VVEHAVVSALEAAAFIALGVAAGTYGTLIGVGGGVLIVPVLLFAHVAPKDAAGTSMAVVLANAASGSLSYVRQRRVDVRAGIIFALAGLPGALLGALADQYVPRRLFSFLFALLLAFVGARLFVRPGQDMGGEAAIADARHTVGFRPWLAAAIGLGAGFAASMFGIGGGIVFVPSMIYLFSFPAHVATATSTFIIALTAIFGTASHAYYHDVLWGPAILIAVGAIAGAQIGVRIAPRVRVPHLMRLFSLAVLLAALWLFYKTFV
jgi:uncharacterized membrane protein YfcA